MNRLSCCWFLALALVAACTKATPAQTDAAPSQDDAAQGDTLPAEDGGAEAAPVDAAQQDSARDTTPIDTAPPQADRPLYGDPDAACPTDWPPDAGRTFEMPAAAALDLAAVHGTAADNVWVAGNSGVFHWSGTQLNAVADAAPFTAVWAFAADDVWVGGSDLRHWDGANWTTAALPGTGTKLHAFWGIAPNDLYAGGERFVAHWDGSTWTTLRNDFLISGLWASATNDVWAIVDYATAPVVRWDGTTYTSYAAPTISGGSLVAIWGVANNDVWAVGSEGAISHFDGSTWTAVQGATTGLLQAIHGRSSTEVWAVGDDGTITQWNGTSWSAPAGVTGLPLRGVWAVPGGDVWAVGSAELLRYNSTTWSSNYTRVAPYPLAVIGGGSATDVWAFPYCASCGFQNGSAHRDAAGWSAVAMQPSNRVMSVWSAPTGEAWAVGDSSMVSRWNGTTWTADTSLSESADLKGVWGFATDDVWVVGRTSRPFNPGFTGHWNGTAWTTTNQPTPLLSVWGPASNDVWAAGVKLDNATVIHSDGTTVQTVLTAAGFTGGTVAIGGSAANDVWLVGGRYGTGSAATARTLHWDGTVWAEAPIEAQAPLERVWVNSPTDVWAFASGGTLWHWDGERWCQVAVPSANVPWLSAWGTANNLWLVGDGSILRLTY
jgi:hypothetical protein